MDNVQRLESIKKQLADLTSKAAVAQAEVARITASLTTLLEGLQEFGVTSYEAAVEQVAILQDELNAEFDVLEEQINAIRGK